MKKVKTVYFVYSGVVLEFFNCSKRHIHRMCRLEAESHQRNFGVSGKYIFRNPWA